MISKSAQVAAIFSVVIIISWTVATPISQPNNFSLKSLRLSREAFFRSNNVPTRKLCLTPGCVEAAARLLSNMDAKVDPCQDFYQFSCGGWLEKNHIPEDRGRINAFGLIQDDVDRNIKVLLEKPISPDESEHVLKAKVIYQSCMNISQIEKVGNKPIQDDLQCLGDWPVVTAEAWTGNNFDWVDAVVKFRGIGYGHSYLLGIGVGSDFENSLQNIIWILSPALGLRDRTHFYNGLNDSVTQAYYKMMVDSAILLGADRSRAEDEMLKALQFEIQLAHISPPSNESKEELSAQYHKMSVGDLMELVPQVDWLKLLNGILNDPIDENEPVVVVKPEQIKKLGELVSKTGKRVLANYLLWRAVYQAMDYLHSPWKKIQQDLDQELSGVTKESPRWQTCLGEVPGMLESALYVQKYFKDEADNVLKKTNEMAKYVKQAFEASFSEFYWMDQKTKENALEKLDAMIFNIGFPRELLDNRKVDKYFKNLQLCPGNYFENGKSQNKWETDKDFSILRHQNDKKDWRYFASIASWANAVYNGAKNSMTITAAILHGAFFGVNRPRYMNFGGIGWVIGHEIGHGYDDEGRLHDKDGNKVNWWSTESEKNYLEKTQCMVEQYGNYTVKEVNVSIDGQLTLGENIADILGAKTAYEGYKAWVKDNGPENSLPGLHQFTSEQIFWLSYAGIECNKMTPQRQKYLLSVDTHSPGKFRVIGPLSNLPEFAKDFNCPVGSPMNPEHKCELW